MDTTESVSASEILEPQKSNGNGHIHTLKPREDAYQEAYEAGLAIGKEAGYRRGYREGFSDCFKLNNPGRGPVNTPEASTRASKKAASTGVKRLRGLPCASCGCPSYIDEVHCPSCGSPNASATDTQAGLELTPQSILPPTRRSRRRIMPA